MARNPDISTVPRFLSLFLPCQQNLFVSTWKPHPKLSFSLPLQYHPGLRWLCELHQPVSLPWFLQTPPAIFCHKIDNNNLKLQFLKSHQIIFVWYDFFFVLGRKCMRVTFKTNLCYLSFFSFLEETTLFNLFPWFNFQTFHSYL